MRIGVFTDTYFPQLNGAAVSIKNLSLELVGRGHSVVIVAPSPDRSFRRELVDGLSVVYLPAVQLPTYPEMRIVVGGYRKALAAAKTPGLDIVHCASPFGVGRMGQRIARKLSIPCVGTYHTFIPALASYFPIPLLRHLPVLRRVGWSVTNRFYGRCAVVSTPSETMRRQLTAHGLRAPLRAISNGIALDSFSPRDASAFVERHGLRDDSIKLVCVGRLSCEKNIEVLLRAVKVLNDAAPARFRLIIVGDGPTRGRLERLARRLGVGAAVLFTGALRGAALTEAVNAADIQVTASAAETQGLAVLEAMACGKPAVGADALAIPEAVVEGSTGYLFRPFDHGDCAAQIAKLAESPSLRRRMGENARRLASRHSMRAVGDEWVALFESLVARAVGSVAVAEPDGADLRRRVLAG